MENKPMTVIDSLKHILKFEEDINDFLLSVQNIHLFERENDILNSARKLEKRIQKMRKFRESFK